MSDYPILFSPEMVKALLDGRKTMTRRLAWRPVKAKMVECEHGYDTCPICDKPKPSIWQKVKLGDRLWVREKFSIGGNGYFFSEAVDGTVHIAWRPAIHMPREVSRLTLEVTATKIERLNEISLEDIQAEGCKPLKSEWAMLWDRVHGEGAYTLNPEVVAISFKVRHCNIDAMPERAAA